MSNAGGMLEVPVGPFTPDESSFELWLERSNFVGGELAGVAYGMHVLLFGLYVYVVTQRHRADLKMYRWSLLYVFALFICGTLNLAFGIKWNQMIWIDDRNFPGGPNAFVSIMFSDPINVASNAAYLTGNILADAFVLWRCFIIWNSNILVILFPVLIFLGTFACGIFAMVQASQPGANLWTRVTVNFLIPYFSLSIALNIIVTLMIVGYLLSHRRSIEASIGKQHAKQYTSIIAMVTESAALYSVFSIIFIIAYGRNDPAQNLFLPALGQVQCIAPLLILLRVAYGRAYTEATSRAVHSGSMQLSNTIQTQSGMHTAQSGDTIALSSVRRKNMGSHGDYASHLSLPDRGLVKTPSIV